MVPPFEYLKHAKNVAAALGIGGIVYSGYTVSGLPIPATVYQVDKRIEVVKAEIQNVNLEVIETQRQVLALRKNVLRSEKYTLSRTVLEDSAGKIALARRLGEIEDDLVDLEKQDEILAGRIHLIRSLSRAPA